MNDIVPLEDWYYYFDALAGTLPSGKRIRTSYIISRDELIITTHTGSRYKLVSPVPTDEDLKYLDDTIRINDSESN